MKFRPDSVDDISMFSFEKDIKSFLDNFVSNEEDSEGEESFYQVFDKLDKSEYCLGIDQYKLPETELSAFANDAVSLRVAFEQKARGMEDEVE